MPTLCRSRLALAALLVLAARPAHSQSRNVDLRLREGTNIAAAVSPDGRTIAFDLVGRLWVMPAAGGTATVITELLAEARQPAWSPDGQRIAFQSYKDGTWHVWSIKPDGSDLRQHTFGMYDDREPGYTGDGQAIVFSSDRAGNYDLWRVELASGALTQLTTDPADDAAPAVNRSTGEIAFVSLRRAGPGLWVRTADGTQAPWVTSAGQVNAPSWSPDGTRLAYNEYTFGEAKLLVATKGGTPQVASPAGSDPFPFRAAWLSNAELLYTGDGKVRRVAATGGAVSDIPFEGRVAFTRAAYTRRARDFDGAKPSKAYGLVGPALSPDGQSVAFGALGDLWVATDGKLTQLTHDPAVQFDPAWSPDGRQLAYVSDKSGTMELWVRDLRAGTDRALTTQAGGAGLPAWTPDGTEIVYQVQRGLGTEIQAVTVATGAVRTVKTGLFLPSRVTFSPDGQLLAVAALHPFSGRYREGRNEILLFDRNGKGDRWVVLPSGRGISTRGNDGPAWSPDGTRMAYVLDGLLWTVPVTRGGELAGPPTRLTSELANVPSWSGDSRSLLYQVTDGLKRVDVGSGTVRPVAVPLTWRRANPTRTIVVHAGRLWDGEAQAARENVDVVVQGHRIARVVPHAASLHRDSVVDASAYTVIPGLADAHAHEGFGVGEGLGRTWLSYGITTIRDPASEPYQMRERREAVEAGVRVGPRALSTGRIFDGERIYYNFNNAMTPGAALGQELERAAQLDFSLIKTYVRLPDALQARIVEVAHANGIPVSSHEIYPAVAIGMDHVEHVSGTSRRGYSPKMSRLSRSYADFTELLAASGMSLTPTLALQGGFALAVSRTPALLDDPRLLIAYGPDYVQGLKAARSAPPTAFSQTPEMVRSVGQTVKRVLAGGGRVMAGTDSPIIPFGLGLQVELQNYVEEAGLTPREALMTATSQFARIVGLERDLGTIAPGKLADLVAVEGNPLVTITDSKRVALVVKNGEVYTQGQLRAGAVTPAARR